MRKTHNYWRPTAKKWKQLQFGIKAIFATISGSVAVQQHPWTALWILVGGMFVNEIIEFFAPEERAKSRYSDLNIKTDKEAQ